MPLVRPDFGEAMMVTFGDGGAASGTVKAITNGEEGAAAMEVDANGDLKSSSPAPAIEDVPDTKHDNANDNGEPLLSRARKCHVCHAEFRRVHHFYDQLCEECSDLNYAKRMQKIDIGGKVALVTGARVKIGFCVALKLLRSGAFVIGRLSMCV